MYKRVLLYSLIFIGTTTLFQNCGKVGFSSASPTLVASNGSPTGGNPIPGSTPGDNNPPSGNEPGGNQNPGGSCGGKTDTGNSDDNSQLVECELTSPHSLVTLAGVLEPGSNASASRICMSENACLNLVNIYAAARNCSLSQGAPSQSPSQQSCTQIFPGSKGTCHNAEILSDGDIVNILASMAK